MIIWLYLYSTALALSWLYVRTNYEASLKNTIFFFNAFVLIYFSGFRDGLGQDYDAYVEVIKSGVRDYGIVEPGYTFLADLVTHLGAEPELFFLIFSVLTLLPLLLVYRKSNNFFLATAVLISIPVLYFNSFNIIRQYAAAAIMLYAVSAPFLENKVRWLICFLLAVSLHISVLFVLPLYLILHLRLSKRFVVFLILVFYAVSLLMQNGLINSLILIPELYSHYGEPGNANLGSGFLTLLIFILLIYVNYVRDVDGLSDFQNRMFNMGVMCLCTYIMIPALFYAHRIAIFFIVALPVVVTIPCAPFRKFGVYKFILVVALSAIFLYFLISSTGNEKVLPSTLKTIKDLFYE